MAECKMFGLDIDKLILAIATVESDRGATSSNVFQLRDIYIDDVNRISLIEHKRDGKPLAPMFLYEDKFSRETSIDMMKRFWRFYGKKYQCLTGNTPTYMVLARMHNGGPYGWRNNATYSYWLRVKKELEK